MLPVCERLYDRVQELVGNIVLVHLLRPKKLFIVLD